MPAAEGNKALNLSIDARVAVAAQRIFAGKPRGKQLSDFVERALIRKCRECGEELQTTIDLIKRKGARAGVRLPADLEN